MSKNLIERTKKEIVKFWTLVIELKARNIYIYYLFFATIVILYVTSLKQMYELKEDHIALEIVS